MDPISDYLEIVATTNVSTRCSGESILPVAIKFPKTFNLNNCHNFYIYLKGKKYEIPFKLITELSKIYSSEKYIYLHLNKKIMFNGNGYLDNYGNAYEFMIGANEYIEFLICFAISDSNVDICEPKTYSYSNLDMSVGMCFHNNCTSKSMYMITQNYLSNFKTTTWKDNEMSVKKWNTSQINDKKFLLKYRRWTIFHRYALYSCLENFLPNEIITMIENYINYDNIFLYNIPINDVKEFEFDKQYKIDIYFEE